MKANVNKTKKGLYQLLGIVLLCFVIIILSYNFTYAWFRDSSETSSDPEVTIIGKIDLDVKTNFKISNLALAPDTSYTQDSSGNSLATTIKTTDEHNIDGAFVRVKFVCNRSEISLIFNNNITTSADYTDGDEEKWYYNSSDGFYYYIGILDSDEITFNNGYFVDNTLYNAKAGADVEMNFYIEGLQKGYGAYKAEWSTAPTIFNSYAFNKTGF